MKVEILCSDGSPLGVSSKTIWGDNWRVGVGGAELALLTMCEEWTNLGHEVVLYNNPREGGASPFEQRGVAEFHPKDERDVVIAFRSTNPQIIEANGLKVWWSTDQHTTGGFAEFAAVVDKIVTISEFHADHFESAYNIKDTITIDLPVRMADYDQVSVDKVPNRLIFTSVPDRGLEPLWRIWPLVLREVPDASLVITSDYRLWGSGENNGQHRVKWMAHDNFEFLGAVSRAKLIEEQLRSQVHIYPCTYDELFCISVAESQYAGSYPVTTAQGALQTTNTGGTALHLDMNDPRNDIMFAKEVVSVLMNPFIDKLQNYARRNAMRRYSPEIIVQRWEDEVFS